MDEEQGLASPLAGGIRGIRRSVSSGVFTGRAVAPPPDPQVTSLLNQNSLTLTTVSGQLSNISAQVASKSVEQMVLWLIEPALIFFGHFIIKGTRCPPSKISAL